MAPVTPPSLEDNSGPPAKSQGQPLESLTSAQIEQDCSEILLGIISEAVTCSEEGTHAHGPTGQTWKEFSAFWDPEITTENFLRNAVKI